MASPRTTNETLRVLNAMLRDPTAEWYGLELSKIAGLQPGTIYPMLGRLLRAGWLERRWEEIDPSREGRPKRRLYRLTGEGARAAGLALSEQRAALSPQPPVHWNPAPGGASA